ncbi:hypothetical protein [Sphingomonas sp.]|uniref:hypothetical protein n=1 Tax=Sphingomonas sp. TaxID=28214 RepID=UPI0031D04F5A
MQEGFASERTIRAALADRAYAAAQVRICDPDLRGYECLAASRNGLFAVGPHGAKRVAYGFFFGLRQHGDALFVFESCGIPSARSNRGRIVRLTLADGRIADATVIAQGLDNQCHQLAVIDSRICLIDTANQAIARFALDGTPLDVLRPFAAATRDDGSGRYHHINSIARVRGQVAVMLHNGTSTPRQRSELAWLDADWQLVRREPLPGYCCHDILEDEAGALWHCGSLDGELLRSSGPPVRVSAHMTRGLALGRHGLIVGTSLFGARIDRPDLAGSVIFLDAQLGKLYEIELPAAPTDLIAL